LEFCTRSKKKGKLQLLNPNFCSMSPSNSSWSLIIKKNNIVPSHLAGVGTNIHLTQPHPRWNSQNCEGKVLTFSIQERITSSETHKPWRTGNKSFPFKSELQGRSEKWQQNHSAKRGNKLCKLHSYMENSLIIPSERHYSPPAFW
jgi:hypothetical protein